MGIITFHGKFSRRIGSLLEGGFTDAILLVEEVEIPVHKCILVAHSEYFSQLFNPKNGPREIDDQRSDASESQDIVECEEVINTNHQSLIEISDVSIPVADNVFELKNTNVEVVRAVLNYFYRGEYDYNENVEIHFLALELAHLFELRNLEDDLINHLVKSTTVKNFVELYNMKMRYKNDQLEYSFLCFLKENGEKIAKGDNFSKLTLVSLLSLLDEDSFAAAEIDIFRAAERWACVNKPNKKTVEKIVERIRLATISQEDLFDFVSISEEFPSIDILEPIRSITKKDAASTNFRQQIIMPVADQNVAQSSLGAEVLSGTVTGTALIAVSIGCTSHEVGGEPDCIVVKLQKTYLLNDIKLLLDCIDGRGYKYYVEVSVDGEEWKRVVDHTRYWCWFHQFLRFDPRAVRFIRITGTEDYLKIISLEAKFTEEECLLKQGIQVASTNVVLTSRGATVTGIHYGSSESMHCIDGKEESYAVVTGNYPLVITLAQPYWLSSLCVRLNASDNCYTIESSSDGQSWQSVCDEGENVKLWRTFEFRRRVVLHFRVTMKKNSSLFNCIELFHFESPASTTAVTN